MIRKADILLITAIGMIVAVVVMLLILVFRIPIDWDKGISGRGEYLPMVEES